MLESWGEKRNIFVNDWFWIKIFFYIKYMKYFREVNSRNFSGLFYTNEIMVKELNGSPLNSITPKKTQESGFIHIALHF